jgi:hypothetical protein
VIAAQFTIPYACANPPFRMMLRLPYAGMLGAEGACHYGDMRGCCRTERPVVPVEQETAVDLCHEMRRSDAAPHAAPGLR